MSVIGPSTGRSGSPVVDLNQRTGSRRCVLHEAGRGHEVSFVLRAILTFRRRPVRVKRPFDLEVTEPASMT
ncbi:hypothetical protein PCAR4_1340036 [Paraburkholderia caribensis]|nr:hypothetical protein PCAR4_1340036 [Paraburkholderia caribensis]